MTNKQTWQRLMSAYPYIREPQQAAHDAAVAAEWHKLSDKQRSLLLADDYRTRIWLAGYRAGQAEARGEKLVVGGVS